MTKARGVPWDRLTPIVKSDLPQPFTPGELRAIVRNVFIGKGVKRC